MHAEGVLTVLYFRAVEGSGEGPMRSCRVGSAGQCLQFGSLSDNHSDDDRATLANQGTAERARPRLTSPLMQPHGFGQSFATPQQPHPPHLDVSLSEPPVKTELLGSVRSTRCNTVRRGAAIVHDSHQVRHPLEKGWTLIAFA